MNTKPNAKQKWILRTLANESNSRTRHEMMDEMPLSIFCPLRDAGWIYYDSALAMFDITPQGREAAV